MKVFVTGATGFTGKKVVDTLLKEGHQVTVLVRKMITMASKNGQLTVVQGDVLNAHLLKKLFIGQDAVVSCLGIGGLGDGRPNNFVSQATRGIVQAMEEAGVSRFICMSNVGAGDSQAYMGWLANKIVIPLFIPKLIPIIEDKNAMEAYVAASSLDFTVVRFPNIRDQPARGKIMATTTGKGLTRSIAVYDAANFMVGQLTTRQFIRQYPSVSN